MIRSEVIGSIGHVVFDRASSKNAFAYDMYGQFAQVLKDLDQNEEVVVIVVTAEGKDFCAGNDIEVFLSADKGALDMLADPEHSPPARAVRALCTLRKPLLGAVEGRAIGFGATLLLHFDYVVMAEDGVLLYPFVDLGLVPEAGSSLLLARQLGQRKAAELLLASDPIPAPTAFELGLVSQLVAPGSAAAKIMKVAERWSKRPARALVDTKALIRGGDEELQRQIAEEFRLMAASLKEPDTQARLAALLQPAGNR